MAEDAIKTLREDLRKGLSKTQAFERLVDNDGDINKGAKILSLVPDREIAANLKLPNSLLISIYSFLVVLNFIGLSPQLMQLPTDVIIIALIVGLLLPVTSIYLLFRMNPIGYLLVAFLMFRATLESIVLLQSNFLSGLVLMGIGAGVMVYAIVMKLKLFPFQNIFHTKKSTNGSRIFTSQPLQKSS
ncbi:MAG: hypothetical protein R3F41_16970 [Gammaproteobacteria bacterium]|nr:hypothetical protein [Pseudomonadales bacterium]